MKLATDDPAHGTENGYNNHECRCEKCRRAHATYMRRKRHRLRIHKPMAEYLMNRRSGI